MEIFDILKNIKEYDFNKMSRCFDNPHCTTIGLWSHWWLDMFNDGYIKDGALGIKTPDGTKYADLNFYDNKGRMLGAIEVENSPESYDICIRNLSYYSKEFENVNFLILHGWSDVDDDGNYELNEESYLQIKSAINKVVSEPIKSQSNYWIIVISKWGKDENLKNIKFDGDWRSRSYIGHEWIVFNKGNVLKDFHRTVGKGEKINLK